MKVQNPGGCLPEGSGLSPAQWKMGYAGGSAEFTKLLKEMGQTEFLPETMSPRQAFQFLQHLAGNQDNL